MDLEQVAPDASSDERFLLLAMALTGRRGLSFSEMVAKGLLGDPQRSKTESLRHTFSLYRRQLEGAGIYLERLGRGPQVRYRVDAARSYADPSSIDVSAHDSVLLSAVLEAYLEGAGTNALASNVRRAYNKLMGLVGLAPADAVETTSLSTIRSKALASLVDACAHRHPVSFLYTGAAAPQRTRLVRIYGTFGRRGHTYLVGADEELLGTREGEREGERNGGGEPAGERPDPMRIFRDDRIDPRSVKVFKGRSYEVPEGFCALDYAKLPFQYGRETPFTATFRDRAGLSANRRADLTEGKGRWEDDLWSVEANDLAALASWAVGALSQGLAPVAPVALLETLHGGLRKAANVHGATGR